MQRDVVDILCVYNELKSLRFDVLVEPQTKTSVPDPLISIYNQVINTGQWPDHAKKIASRFWARIFELLVPVRRPIGVYASDFRS